MTGGIYRNEFEAMKAPHIMRSRMSYMSVARVFAGKNKLLEKSFGKTSECYVDCSKVQLAFSRIQRELSKDNQGNFLSIIQLLAKYDIDLDKLLQLLKGSPKYLSPLIQNELISVLVEEVLRNI